MINTETVTTLTPQQKWALANPEKVAEYQAAYRAKNPDKVAAWHAASVLRVLRRQLRAADETLAQVRSAARAIVKIADEPEDLPVRSKAYEIVRLTIA